MNEQKISILLNYRLEQARESLQEANLLKDAGYSPRSIVNRSYYAMFYTALALLQTVGKITRKHSGVLELFDREFTRTGKFSKELSQNFHEVFNARNKSDYADEVEVSKEKAFEIHAQAGAFVEAVTRFLDKGSKHQAPPDS